MTQARRRTLAIENVSIPAKMRNFRGEQTAYNNAGNRNFCILVDEDSATTLEAEGWNIKYLRPIDEDDTPQAFMKVTAKYGNYPPKVVLITGAGRTDLDEDTIGALDWADIKLADIVISPYYWEVNGKEGVAAYLKALYVTLDEDEFAHKYHDVPEAGSAGLSSDEPDHEPDPEWVEE